MVRVTPPLLPQAQAPLAADVRGISCSRGLVWGMGCEPCVCLQLTCMLIPRRLLVLRVLRTARNEGAFPRCSRTPLGPGAVHNSGGLWRSGRRNMPAAQKMMLSLTVLYQYGCNGSSPVPWLLRQ